MSLAAPTNVQIGTVSRVPIISGSLRNYSVNVQTGLLSFGGSSINAQALGLRFTARVTWTNNELSNHWLVVTVKRVSPSNLAATVSETLVPRAAQGFDVVLEDWLATTSLANRSYTIEVKLVSPLGGESSVSTVNYNLALSDSYTASGEIFYEDASEAIDGISGFNLPSRTEKVRLGGGASMARISYTPLGTTVAIKPYYDGFLKVGMWKEAQYIPQVIADYGELKISGLSYTNDLGLRNGGFYRATVTYVQPKAPTVVQINNIHYFTDYHQEFTKEVVFEYWKQGYPKPVITTVLEQSVQAGETFSTRFTANGANSLSVDFGSLTGITYNSSTGIISGVFTTGGEKQITLNATNTYGVTSKILKVNVEVPPVAITSSLARTATAGAPFSYVVAASGATTTSVNFGGESGLTYDAGTRTISGTFTSAGTKTIAITASNEFNSVTRNLLVTVSVVTPSFTSALTAAARVGLPFSYTVAANNAATYSVSFGTVSGLTFNAQTQVISGTLTAAGTYNVSLTAENTFASQTSTLVITAAAVEPVIGAYLPVAITRSGQVATATLTAHGFSTGDVVNIAGAAQSEYNGDRTITVTGVNTFTFAVTGTPATPATGGGVLGAPSVSGPIRATAVAGEPFVFNVAADAATEVSADLSGQSGLTFNSGNRRISGVFTSGGSNVIALVASNLGAATTRNLTVTVAIPQPNLTSAATVASTAGTPFEYRVTATNTTTIEVLFGAITGLNFNAATGVISGAFATTLDDGPQNITIRLSNAYATKDFNLRVDVTLNSLRTPGDLKLARLFREWGGRRKVGSVSGDVLLPREFFDVKGELSWTNTESKPHQVLVTVNGVQQFYPARTTRAVVQLARYAAPDVATKTANITVKLVGVTLQSEEASLQQQINGVAAATFSSPSLSVQGNDLVPAEWSGQLDVVYDALERSANLGTITYSLGTGTINGGQLQVTNPRSVALPSSLLKDTVYQAKLFFQTAQISAATTTVQSGWTFIAPAQPYQPAYVTYRHYNAPNLLGSALSLGLSGIVDANRSVELFFTAPEPVGPFVAKSANVTVLINTAVRIELESSYRATWLVASGAPTGLSIEYQPQSYGAAGPEKAFLVGTVTVPGNYTMALVARRALDNVETTATLTLSALTELPRTVVTTNNTLARDGLSLKTNDEVNVAFVSTPSPAVWQALGLPPGVSISVDGKLLGRPTRSGNFMASITAQAEGLEVSLPTTIRFSIAGDDISGGDGSASRVPWVLNRWDLVDLQVLVRSRRVESSMFEGGALRIKLGDAIQCGVFFVDVANDVFALDPDSLRLTVRKADNLDDLVVFTAEDPPQSAVEEGQKYYLLDIETGEAEREVVLEWLEANKKNEPLACVADIDWEVNGKRYSSRTFPVSLEMDVTRP
jgi:hypothetical protein